MSSPETTIEIRSFKGINIREPPSMVQDDELVECINFDIGRAGELTKRTGFAQIHDGATLGLNSVRLIGHYNTSTYSQILVRSGNTLYYSNDGVSFTAIGNYNIEFGVQYIDKFYMVRTDGDIIEWNGIAATVLADTPRGTYCSVYKDRLFVINSSSTDPNGPSELKYSEINDFSDFPSINVTLISPGDGDILTCLAVIHDTLIVFKVTKTYAYYVQGQPESWVLRVSNPEIGCISKYTPREIEGFLFFVGPRGVYKTDGNLFEDISSSIQPVFEDRLVNLTNVNIDTAAWWDDKYFLLFNPTPSTQRYFIYHLRTGGWTEWVPNGIKPGTFLEINTSNPGKGLYAGDLLPSGKIFRYGGGAFTDAGVQYVCSLKTKDYDFGLPTDTKRGKWVGIDTKGTGLVTLEHWNEEALVDSIEFSSQTGKRVQKARGPGFFRSWAGRVVLTTNTEFQFFGISLVMHRKRQLNKAST